MNSDNCKELSVIHVPYEVESENEPMDGMTGRMAGTVQNLEGLRHR
jgi:hypothetical protein